MPKIKKFYPAKLKEKKKKTSPRFSHFYQKINDLGTKKFSNTLFLWGKVKNNAFHNVFFTIPIKNLFSENDFSTNNLVSMSNLEMNGKVKPSYDFIIELSNKTPALPSIKQQNELIFSENSTIFRFNLITKQKTIYKPNVGELGEIISSQSRIQKILDEADGKYVRIRRISLDNEMKNTKFTEIKSLQLVVDGWFKGYVEIGEPLKGKFDFKIVDKKEIIPFKKSTDDKKSKSEENHKIYKYTLNYKKITAVLKTHENFTVDTKITAKIKDLRNGIYTVEHSDDVDMTVGW